MAIHRLPSDTIRLLSSAPFLPSFEAAVSETLLALIQAGAKSVLVKVLPTPLRFTISSTGPGIHSNHWAHILRPTSSIPALAALATLSTVELTTRHLSFSATTLVRAGNVLSDAQNVPTTILPHSGVIVDTWEMFCATPVRRNVEQNRHPEAVLHATQQRVGAVALANPHIPITMLADNARQCFVSNGISLSVDSIQAAFGSAHSLDWGVVHVSSPCGFCVDGFLSRTGISNSKLQLVSVDGVPAEGGWVRQVVQRLWKRLVARKTRCDVPRKRFPAYVLNCHTSTKRTSKRISSSSGRHAIGSESLKGLLTTELMSTLGEELMDNKSSSSVQASIPFPSKKRSTREERFSDALICNRVKRPPSSTWGTESRLNIYRPFSEGIIKKPRVCIKRPSTAKAVELAYKRNIPGWCNPCFRAGPSASRKAINTERNIGCGSFDKRAVNISRENIPNLRVVGQVDDKFIIVVNDEAVMYAIDQHAASERFLYENLLRRIIPKVRGVDLTRAVAVTLSYTQRAVIAEHSNLLHKWGWTLSLESSAVKIIQAPLLASIDVVLKSSEHLLDFLDSILDGALPSSTPRPIIDAIASAACHSAVRFGDKLTQEQCKSLVYSLAECRNPFSCAHGRPSIVPLVSFHRVEERVL